MLVGRADFDYYLRRLKRYLHLPVRQESLWAVLHSPSCPAAAWDAGDRYMTGRKHRAVKACGFLARASLIFVAVLVQTNASPAHGGSVFVTAALGQPSKGFSDNHMRGANTGAGVAAGEDAVERAFGSDRVVAGEADLPGWLVRSEAEGGAARDVSSADGVRVPIMIRVSEEDVRMAAEDGGRLASLVGAPWVDMIAYVVAGNSEDRPMLKTAGGYVGTPQGLAMDVIGRLARGKPRLVSIGNGGGDGAALDADELRAVVWSAVIHGASGIIYDDRGPAPGTSDGTPAALNAEMVEIHRLMKDMGNILLASTGLPNGVLLRMAPRGEMPAPDMMPYPFEARAYRTGDRVFYAILNLSQEGGAVLDHAPFGIRGMAFRRYEVKFGYLPDDASYGRTGEAP
ncbi:MAG: hypothetical protein ACTHLT_20980 [Devosia sp.]